MGTSAKDVLSSMMKEMEGFVTSKTVVGDPVNINDTIILPLVDISFGVGAGANEKEKGSGGGGGGLGAKITPSAVLVIKDGNTKLVNIKKQDSLTKLIDLVPDVIDKFQSRKEEKKDPEVEAEIEGLK